MLKIEAAEEETCGVSAPETQDPTAPIMQRMMSKHINMLPRHLSKSVKKKKWLPITELPVTGEED